MTRKIYELVGALFGFLVMAAQLAVSLPALTEKGGSLAGGLIQFFSFFTILSNCAVVLFYLAALMDWKPDLLRASKWQTAMALYISIVCFIYAAVLADIWEPEGIFKWLDISLHYVAPALFVLYWLIFVQHGEAAYADTPKWLVPGFVYVIYVLIRGALTGLYPYPFLDAAQFGYLKIARNVVLLLLFFFVVGLAYVAIDHALARLKTPTREL